MEMLNLLMNGFSLALQPLNLLFSLIGVVVGTMVGVLPGLGPISAVALLLPVTFSLNPLTAMIMMAGVYVGAMYGGSTTSILLNTPGESASVVTTLDGFQLARQGRAGSALGVAAIGSWIAGTLGIFFMMLMSPALAKWAITFQPAEYAALMILGLTTVSGFTGDTTSMVKPLISMVLGLMVGTIGRDLQTGTLRFAFESEFLADGIDFLVLSLGLFAITEVLWESGESVVTERVDLKGSVYPTREDLRTSAVPMLRGGLLGFFLGVLPGVGASTSSFISYGVEKNMSRHPERFGKGAIEGVAGPEAANNGAAIGAMVPLLTLGLPGSGTTAVMLGALIMFGLQPGPLLIPSHPDLFWGLIASLYLGNTLLLILNLPMVRLFVKILDIPKALLLPLVLALSFIGVYAIANNTFDLLIMLGFGVLGILMRATGFPPAPMVLALVLGPMLEQSVRQTLIISRGNPAIFVTRPISATILAVAVFALLYPAYVGFLRRRRQQRREETHVNAG